MAALTSGRREFAATLLLGAAGAGLVLLAVRQGWAAAHYAEPAPLASRVVRVTGQDLVPAAGALALAGLACLAAVIATRGVARRAAGVVLAGFGAGTVAAVSGAVSAHGVLAAAAGKASAATSSGGAGSATSGSPSSVGTVTGGSAAHVIMSGVPWRAFVVAGGLAIVAAGILTLWRGVRWPVMSGRFDRPGQREPESAGPAARPAPRPAGSGALDAASLWESLSQGIDPTDTGAAPENAARGVAGGRQDG